jgi:hypothetical protein
MARPANPFVGKKCIQADNELRMALEKKLSTAGADHGILDAELDSVMQGKMNDATLIKKFPQNNLSAMVLSGAKGGVVN